ncbi:MAG: metallophosphoesterase [Candidatus Woesearchaeota archaeon]
MQKKLHLYSDLHLPIGNKKPYKYISWIFAFWQHANIRKIPFLKKPKIILGDICEGGKKGLEQKYEPRIAHVAKKLKPAYFVCGNHDLGAKPNKESITLFESYFSPLFYSFTCDKQTWVVISSSLYTATELDAYARKKKRQQNQFLQTVQGNCILCFHDPNAYTQIKQHLVQANVEHIFCGHLHTPILNKNQEITIVPSIGGLFFLNQNTYLEFSQNTIRRKKIKEKSLD